MRVEAEVDAGVVIEVDDAVQIAIAVLPPQMGSEPANALLPARTSLPGPPTNNEPLSIAPSIVMLAALTGFVAKGQAIASDPPPRSTATPVGPPIHLPLTCASSDGANESTSASAIEDVIQLNRW